MAAGDVNITVVGNLVADPELRFTTSGAAVANFRVASTTRTFNRQTGEWEEGDSMFLTCIAWRQMAENVGESLQKGMRVMVSGRLRQRSYDTREGERRTVFEVEVDEVGPSLRYATASVSRNPRNGGQGGGYGGQSGSYGGGQRGGYPQAQQQRPAAADQGQPPAGGGYGGFGGGQPSAPETDPWNSAPQTGGFADDEPPF